MNNQFIQAKRRHNEIRRLTKIAHVGLADLRIMKTVHCNSDLKAVDTIGNYSK